MNTLEPLVSVPVITYNSSKTVVETLDSIYNQTYPKLELIISDDCSTDDTVEVCRSWIESHKDRFVRTELLTVEKNTGITANMNRAEEVCLGEWVKPIAGDDVLLLNCIEDYVSFVKESHEAYFCFGRAVVFDGTEERRKKYEHFFLYDNFKLTPDEQYRYLLESGNFICAVTFFYNRGKMVELGIRNDERIPLMEDYPKWINILAKGGKFSFLDKEVVKYRMSSSGISSQDKMPLCMKQQFALLELLYRQPYELRLGSKSKRQLWRRRLYAENVLEPQWYRTIILGFYECGATIYRLVSKKGK